MFNKKMNAPQMIWGDEATSSLSQRFRPWRWWLKSSKFFFSDRSGLHQTWRISVILLSWYHNPTMTLKMVHQGSVNVGVGLGYAIQHPDAPEEAAKNAPLATIGGACFTCGNVDAD